MASARVIMVQGTASHVGKSVLVSALCRIFAQDGLRVAPFKAQNMSLNSAVTPDGLEIGRAQAIQAEAARVAPRVEMNPVLLKPEADNRSQVVVMGKPAATATAREYYERKTSLWPVVADALDRLRSEFDVVVIEGAGSPAEINLKAHEIVNMRVARHAGAGVVLVGDIERGGVFASLVGTMALLDAEEARLVRAFVINKFRGDPSLLDSGLEAIAQRTGVPFAGVLPYFTDIHIPEEDSVGIPDRRTGGADAAIDVAVVRLPHIANFDDFDPLRREPGVAVRFVQGPEELDGADLVVLPGTETTVEDLDWLRKRGLADAVAARRREGTPVIGICGGYQMLGRRILDPHHAESRREEVEGLGLLPVTTAFASTKETHRVTASVVGGRGLLEGCGGAEIEGYEIHMGRTETAGEAPFRVTTRSSRAVDSLDGATDAEGCTLGTYIHGLFHNDALRRSLLRRLAEWKGVALDPAAGIDAEYDKLAAFVREHLDIRLISSIAGLAP